MQPSFLHSRPGRNAGPDHILGVEHLLDCIDGVRAELGIEPALPRASDHRSCGLLVAGRRVVEIRHMNRMAVDQK